MSETQSPTTMPLSLGGRLFQVPRLPLGVTLLVYPICRRLTKVGLDMRILADEEISDEERSELTELAFQAAHVADEALDVKAFMAMPVTPQELSTAFFVVRLQCGGWRLLEGRDGQGEGMGTATSPT